MMTIILLIAFVGLTTAKFEKEDMIAAVAVYVECTADFVLCNNVCGPLDGSDIGNLRCRQGCIRTRNRCNQCSDELTDCKAGCVHSGESRYSLRTQRCSYTCDYSHARCVQAIWNLLIMLKIVNLLYIQSYLLERRTWQYLAIPIFCAIFCPLLLLFYNMHIKLFMELLTVHG